MEELKKIRDQTLTKTIDNESSSKVENSLWSNSLSGNENSKRVNTSKPSSNTRKISPPNFKPDIVKVSEQRKHKRSSNIKYEEPHAIRNSMKSNMTTRIKNYEHKLFNNLKVEEEKQAKKIEQLQKTHATSLQNKLKGNYYSEKRNSTSLQDDIMSPDNVSQPKMLDGTIFAESEAASSASRRNKYRTEPKEIPEIQIKVGVQNNHYSFFNTIHERDEDDDNVVALIGIKKKKYYKYKKSQSKDYKYASPKDLEAHLPFHSSSKGRHKDDIKNIKEFL